MTSRQRKYLEGIFVLALLWVIVWFFQDNALIARLAFVPAAIYFLLNWRAIRAIENVGPSPKQVIEGNSYVRLLVVALLAAEIFVACYSLISGDGVADYLNSVGILLLALIGPLLPPVIASQVYLYRRLGDECP